MARTQRTTDQSEDDAPSHLHRVFRSLLSHEQISKQHAGNNLNPSNQHLISAALFVCAGHWKSTTSKCPLNLRSFGFLRSAFAEPLEMEMFHLLLVFKSSDTTTSKHMSYRHLYTRKIVEGVPFKVFNPYMQQAHHTPCIP